MWKSRSSRAFDGRILKRFWAFISPYRRQLLLAVLAVLAFAASQIAIPLILRTVIDHALVEGAHDERLLAFGVLVFFGVVTLNFLANLLQETLVARIAERLLVNLRRAMYAHLQRVSLSFMDKTEVGRLMSRLQGDVHALQEFLETSVFAIGDFVLLVGITIVLLVLDWRLGLLTLSVVPVLVARAHRLAAARETRLPARTGHQLDAERRPRRGHPRRPDGSGHGPRGGQPPAVRGEGRRQSEGPAAGHLAGADHGADRRHPDRRRDGHRHRGRRHGRARRPARARRDGRLPVLRPALLRSDPLADHAVQRPAARHGVGPAHLRGAGRADPDPGQAGRARSRRASTARSSSAT